MTPAPQAGGFAASGLRVLVAAPTRRDGEVTGELLARSGIRSAVFGRLGAIADEVAAEGGALDVGAIVLTDVVVADRELGRLVEAMEGQPPWSDIPVLLLTREKVRLAAGLLGPRSNLTLLERPSSTRVLLSAVESALRARQRQYQIRDQLTAQHQAEAALRDADTRKDEFLATLAHELRNPLAAIRTGVELITRAPENRQRAERTVGMIDRQSRMLTKLVDELMDVSRIATGKVVLQQDRIDLRAVLEAGLEAGQTVFDASRHHFHLALPPAPVWIRGDASRLAQVVGNLVNNAGKYTPDGGHISVGLAKEDGAAVLRIADTGLGIPPEQLERVFDMFTQVDRTLDRARGGLGIGLSLVRRLVGLHGGSVAALSEGAGHGSTFVVKLPLSPEPVAEAGGSAPSPAPAAARRLRILVVDDNRDFADGLAALLTEDGHEIRVAYDGLAGLEEAGRFAPELVFCDIGMPKMTGHEVARAIRAERLAAPPLLVAMTGWGNPEDRRLSIDAGFDVHYTKPVSAEQIEAALARVAGAAA